MALRGRGGCNHPNQEKCPSHPAFSVAVGLGAGFSMLAHSAGAEWGLCPALVPAVEQGEDRQLSAWLQSLGTGSSHEKHRQRKRSALFPWQSIESSRLEKTTKVTQSNHQAITTMPTKHIPQCIGDISPHFPHLPPPSASATHRSAPSARPTQMYTSHCGATMRTESQGPPGSALVPCPATSASCSCEEGGGCSRAIAVPDMKAHEDEDWGNLCLQPPSSISPRPVTCRV